jgi:hypothetical protein
MRKLLSAALLALTAACSVGSTEPAGPDGLAFIGVPATADACETLPVLEVSAVSSGQLLTTFNGDVTVAIQSGTGVPAATLSGLRTVKALGGVATFTDLSINASGPGYRLVFSATGAGTVSTPAFDVIPGGPDQLAFTASPPVNSSTLTLPPVRVAVRDACGATIPNSAAQVTLSFNNNASSATLLGTTTVSAVNGVASFLDLSVNKAGPGLTLAAASPGLKSATSIAFTVAAPPAR